MLLIFDLDGTLIDSKQDLVISVNATLAEFKMPPLPDRIVQSYVGNGSAVLIRRAMGDEMPQGVVDEAHKFFLQYYRKHSLANTRLYDGIEEALSELSDGGHRMAVLTNKPVKISFDILAGLKVGQHFFRTYGGDSLPNKKPDPVGIVQLMREAEESADTTLMIGDSGVDVQTARNANVKSCGVAWGFQPEAFNTLPPDFVISEPRELVGELAGLVAGGLLANARKG